MSKKDPIRFGVIGVGLWGEVHAEIYSQHPYATLAAVCDRDGLGAWMRGGQQDAVARARQRW